MCWIESQYEGQWQEEVTIHEYIGSGKVFYDTATEIINTVAIQHVLSDPASLTAERRPEQLQEYLRMCESRGPL